MLPYNSTSKLAKSYNKLVGSYELFKKYQEQSECKMGYLSFV